VNEEQQKILDDLMWKGEMAMRDRGLGDAQIAEKKQELRRAIEQFPADAAGWERLARIDGGEPPETVIPAAFGKNEWIVRVAEHRALLALGVLAVAALFGYFDAGLVGLLVGLAIATFAMLYATISARRRRR
jgi:hypothetical protein